MFNTATYNPGNLLFVDLIIFNVVDFWKAYLEDSKN